MVAQLLRRNVTRKRLLKDSSQYWSRCDGMGWVQWLAPYEFVIGAGHKYCFWVVVNVGDSSTCLLKRRRATQDLDGEL